MKPNDKKEIDRLQEELDELKSDINQGVDLHIALAVQEMRNLEVLLSSESLTIQFASLF